MNKEEFIKSINGELYYKYDYAYWLYEQLEIKDKEIERLNNIIANMEEELMTMYLDIMEYNEDYAKREIKNLKELIKSDLSS